MPPTRVGLDAVRRDAGYAGSEGRCGNRRQPLHVERHPTIRDVAALAAVSTGTVSKALNGRGSLRPETRRRVLEAAEHLGFRANAAARSLPARRSYTVGMITTDSIGRFNKSSATIFVYFAFK